LLASGDHFLPILCQALVGLEELASFPSKWNERICKVFRQHSLGDETRRIQCFHILETDNTGKAIWREQDQDNINRASLANPGNTRADQVAKERVLGSRLPM
jgi:hypothetical protein